MSNLYSKFYAKTWREAILHEMQLRGDAWSEGTACSAPDEFLDSQYDFDYTPPRPALTVWTDRFVYFATLYDGYVGVGSVPRHPCAERSLNQDGTTQFKPHQRNDDSWAA